MHALAATTEPYFFLSYAHKSRGDAWAEGEPDYWVGELFRDLCRAVEQQTKLPKGASPGFMDRDRRVGDDWPPGVVRALASCRVFVPLYSSRYFADEYCGKEWNFFTNRASDLPTQDSAIVPAIWDPVEPGKLPQAAQAPHCRYRGSEAYETLGLYGIMKVSRYRKQYEEAVRNLAGLMAAAAERHPVKQRQAGDPSSLESAFGPVGVYLGGPEPTRVRITVVAPRRDELPDERGSESIYGSSTLDWNPYATDPARPIAQEAAAVARSLSYGVEVGDLYQHADDLLSGDARYGPQILIIDPWALLVPRTQQLLQRVDDSRLPWVQAIILWNVADGESRNSEGELRGALYATLRRKLAETTTSSLMAAQGIPTIDDFEEVLCQVIGAAAKKFLRNAAAYPPGGEVVERLRLS
jgi:FxsC-like protein